MKILFRFYGFRERVDKDGHLKNVHLHSRHLILAKVDTMEILKPILYNRHVYIVYTVVYIIAISYFGILTPMIFKLYRKTLL